MKRIFITVVTLFAFAAPAYAVPLSIGDAYYVGSINDGIPSSLSSEADYINALILLAKGQGDTTCATTEICNRGGSTLDGPFPTAVVAGSVKVDDPPVITGINTAGFTYIIAKYDAEKAGSLVWLLDGTVSVVDLPSTYNNQGLSHYSLFNPGVSVPEPATLGLLGIGLVGLGLFRRRRVG